MKYQGSKRRIANEILPIILRDRKEGQWYIEPFAGGLNTCMLVKGNVLANDVSLPLISLYKGLQNNFIPPKIVTEEDYKNAKLLDDTNPLKGYIGFNMSFACKYFGGYARQTKGSSDCPENARIRSRQSYRDVLKTKNEIGHIKFENKNYYDLDIPDNSIIYCDPPYVNTTGYKTKFDHDKFYQWCLDQHDKGHKVFISEYYMPEDKFECVWERPIKTNLGNCNTATTLERIEKLFIVKKINI